MNQVVKSENPFGKQVSQAQQSAVANSDVERAAKEVEAKLVIAKRFPRDQQKAMDDILNACTRPTLANTALYVYSRGGTDITGPSIRLAETLAQEWGNIDFGIRELSSVDGVSTVEAFAWDMERNTRQSKVFQVPHERHTRSGVKKLTDPRDIYELIANNGARRMRACILGVIPGDVTEAAVNQCNVTQQANIDTSPEAIKTMVKYFEEKYGVSKELIEKRIQRKIESIRPAQMQLLKNIAESLKDGMSKAADWFEVGTIEDTSGPKVSDLDAGMEKAPEGEAATEEKPASRRSKKSADKPAKEKHAGEDAQGADESTAPWAGVADPVQYFLDGVKAAKSIDELYDVVSVASEFYKSDDCNADQQKHLEAAIDKRIAEFQAVADNDPANQ